MSSQDPFDLYERNASDNDPAVPSTTGLIPHQRRQSDPNERFPHQSTPEEH